MTQSTPRFGTKLFQSAGAIIAAGILLRLALVFITPAWQSADERSYFAVAQHLATHNRMPEVDPRGECYEAYQPPLFFVVAAGVLKFCPGGMPFIDEIMPPDLPLVAIRLLNLIFSVVTLVFCWRIFERMTVLGARQRLTALAVVAFLPTYAGVSSSVNNDSLAICLSAISIYFALEDRASNRALFLAGLFAGLALLVKLTAIILLPVLFLRLMQARKASDYRPLGRTVAMVGGWLIGFGMLVSFNMWMHGTPIAIMPGVERGFNATWWSLGHAIVMLSWSFWLAFGRVYQIHPHAAFYMAIALPMTLAAIYGCWREYRQATELIILAGAGTLCGAAFSLWFTLTTPSEFATSWGKNLYPLLPLIAAALSYGWHASSARAGNRIAMASITAMVVGCVWVGWIMARS